jgi:hypothetical protein
MERRSIFVALVVFASLAGCNSSSAPESANSGSVPSAATAAATPATYADPAAQVAHEFLNAVVSGDTSRANSLLTPLAIERITASGKPFQLPGLANYTFRVGQVKRPAPDKAFVQCTGTDRTSTDKAVEEDFCWLMTMVDQDWRIAGISYSAGPQQTLMIYSFENPEKGAIPVQQLMAQPAGQTAATSAPPTQPMQTQPYQSTQPVGAPMGTPRTAQEAAPAGSYR